MSRIYEAMQRADREHNAFHGLEVQPGAEAPIAPCIVAVPEIKSEMELDFKKITRHIWRPVEASLPTMANVGASVEQFRGLRARIDQLRIQASIKTVLVSSGMPGEGKTFIASNLALSMARNALNSILLIDGDLRRGTLHKLLGAPNSPGLGEYLAGTAELMSIMQRCALPDNGDTGVARGLSHVTFIPAGISTNNSSEAIASHRMRSLIAVLAPQFDWIVIDSPPVLAVTDAVELARAADAVLLVVRSAETPLDVAQRTQAAFSNSRLLGVVLNAVKKVPRDRSYSYYYGGEAGQRQ
jgi:protein-tyrosine kinase